MTPAAEVRTRLLACAAITGLAALLTGLPVVLWSLAEITPLPTVRWPVPDFSPWAAPLPVQLGDWAEHLAETLRFELNPSRCALLGVLLTGWASWALLLAWTAADLARLLVPGRSRPVRRGTPRAWLTTVITWAVLPLFPGTLSAAPVATPPSVTALMPPPEGVAATPVYGDAPVGPGGYPDPPPGPTTTDLGHPRYTVVRGDTLWDLAERYLGNPHRWGQLRDLNHDLIQGTDRLETGWVLRMPTDATLPTPAGVPATARWITTEPGDTLATLAARELGSPDQWPVLFAVNAERPQPDGRVLRDPHHLFPGWHLALPAPPLPDPVPEAVSPGPAVAPPRVSPAPEPVIADTGEIQLDARTFLGAATAAAVSAALVLARRRHRRHHRPGTRATADYPIAPAVYALHRAHRTSTTHAPDDEPEAPRGEQPLARGPEIGPSELWLEIGVADGETRHLNFSDVRRIGVTGAGAHDVVRAMLVNLALHPERPRLSIHTAAVAALFPNGPPPGLSHWHQITDLHATPPGQLGDVLVAYTAVLDDDALPPTEGVAVLALGPSPAGAQLAVEDRGVVSGASHEVSSLIGARLFAADEATARDLLALGRAPQHNAGLPVHLVLQDREPPPFPFPAPPESPEDRVPLSLRVFGPVRLLWTSPEGEREDITEHFTPRLLELLAYLAVNPGATRDTAIADLWQHAPSNRPTNALNTTLSRLRTALESATHGTVTDIFDDARQRRLNLDPAQVNTDYAAFNEAEHTSHDTTTEPRRLHAHHTVVELYQGELAAGIDSEWIQAPRFAALRTAINAVSALARHHAPTDPERTLRLLETATGFDPANEHLYRDIMRLHARLGDTTAIPATLDLLTQRLRDIDTEPAPETLALATALQHPDSEPPATKGEPARSGGLHPAAPKSH